MSSVVEKETRSFETEVTQLLHLMVHALYSNKEIFLRELISNSADAIDKLRFETMTKPELVPTSDFAIHVDFDEKQKTITIKDNGIGMTKAEIISHLGTIARSGTREFLKNLTGNEAKDRHLIGQFGVGFYSSFIVAEEVTVLSRSAHASQEEGVCWRSKGEGNYTVEAVPLSECGTTVILHLRKGEEEFLNAMRLRHIVTKYSDHINVPVMMKKENHALDPQEEAKETVSDNVERPLTEEVVNRVNALWTLPKGEIKKEAYCEFFKYIAHAFEDPWDWVHKKVEGKFEYTTLLFIPPRAPFDLWQPNKPRGLKLYVKRVFIMDDAEQFLPNYLRFVRGVVDSNDLPLNISREILQSNRLVDAIRASIVKSVLGMLSDVAQADKEKYAQFWHEFGQVLKEGPAEDFANKEKIAKLLRFASTHSDTEKQEISLDDYISRMKEGQEKLYYIAADNFNAAKNSPHLEIFRKNKVEVLLLADRIDEWLMSHLTEYQGKQFQSVAMGAIENLDFIKQEEVAEKEEASKREKEKEDFKPVLEKVKKALGEKVKEVRLSGRLTNSPSCIVAEEGQMTSQMQRLLRSAGKEVHVQPILELNPHHLLVEKLKQEKEETRFNDLSHILFDQAVLAEGGQLDDPAHFIKLLNELLLHINSKTPG